MDERTEEEGRPDRGSKWRGSRESEGNLGGEIQKRVMEGREKEDKGAELLLAALTRVFSLPACLTD